LNGVPQIAAVKVRIGTVDFQRLIPEHRLQAELGLPVKFDERGHSLGVSPSLAGVSFCGSVWVGTGVLLQGYLGCRNYRSVRAVLRNQTSWRNQLPRIRATDGSQSPHHGRRLWDGPCGGDRGVSDQAAGAEGNPCEWRCSRAQLDAAAGQQGSPEERYRQFGAQTVFGRPGQRHTPDH
jgi:hypothetical protein